MVLLRHCFCVVHIRKIKTSLFRLDHGPFHWYLERIQSHRLGSGVKIVVSTLGLFVPAEDEMPPWDLHGQRGERSAIHVQHFPPIHLLKMWHRVPACWHLPHVSRKLFLGGGGCLGPRTAWQQQQERIDKRPNRHTTWDIDEGISFHA